MLASGLQLYLKETLAQVFSCEVFEISNNMLFTEHLWTTASRGLMLLFDFQKNEAINSKTRCFVVGPSLYSTIWLSCDQFCMKFVRCKLLYFQLKSGTPVFEKFFRFSRKVILKSKHK